LSATDLFARAPKTPISPFELNNEGRGQALVLRYAGCNLGPASCPLCYAWRYAWVPGGHPYPIKKCFAALSNLSAVASKKIVWVRIQGGEPCLHYNRIANTFALAAHALTEIHQQGLNHYEDTRAVIQTNGIAFGGLPPKYLAFLRDLLDKELSTLGKGRIIMEVSFKSPSRQKLLDAQIKGFNAILHELIVPLWETGYENIAVYPIAGLGPSIDFHNVWLVPIDPNALPSEKPLFHPSTWLPQYRTLLTNFRAIVSQYAAYRDFRHNPRTGSGQKVAIEELEPTWFQTSWISGYAGGYNKAGIRNVPPIRDLLRRLSRTLDRQWGALFHRHRHWQQVLNQIPVAQNPQLLLAQIKQMNAYFYPSHPQGHYPYL